MKRSTLLRVLTLATLVGAALTAQAVELVQDGDFELAALGTSNPTTPFSAGQTFDGFWFVGGTGVAIDTNDGFNISGQKSVFLDFTNVVDPTQTAPGSITQSLATVVGQMYSISFDVHTDGPSAFTAMFGGTTLLNNAQVPILTFPNATHFTFNATATSLSTALTFAGSSDALSTVELDNVSVQPVAAVPEPATLAALGLGFAALARRRKRDAKLQLP